MAKLLQILQLFTLERPRWRVDSIAQQMGVSTSTGYRCVAELVRSGFLQPVSGGSYVLGPAFSEFDRRMRLSDPLLTAGRVHAKDLDAAIGQQSTIVLSRYYRDCVMIAYIRRAPDVTDAPGRGQQISIFSPAASARAVLLALPDRVLRALHQSHADEIAGQGLGQDAREFRANVRALRERGWVVSHSALGEGRLSIAAPVVCDGAVRGALAVSLLRTALNGNAERVGELVMQHANLIAADLRRDEPDVPRLLGRRAALAPSEREASRPGLLQ